MQNLAVHWYEGLFVEAQHFQAAHRFAAERAARRREVDHPYAYGIREFAFDPVRLNNGVLELVRLAAFLPDGTALDYDKAPRPDEPPEQRESLYDPAQWTLPLEGLFEAGPKVLVYLALPQVQAGQENVSLAGPGGNCRYFARPLTVRNESHGRDARPLSARIPNVRLMHGGQDLSGFIVLPVVQLEKGALGQGFAHVDPTYFPPLLACGIWPHLAQDVLDDTYAHLEHKALLLGESLYGEHGTETLLTGKESGRQTYLLHQLNQVLADLSVAARTPGCRPFDVYLELCRCIGRMAIFKKGRTVEERPPYYDHDRLADIFLYAKKELREAVSLIRDPGYERRYFEGARFAPLGGGNAAPVPVGRASNAPTAEGIGLQIQLDAKWLRSGWDWYVGIYKYDLTNDEVAELLNRIDWKLGPQDEVSRIFVFRENGLKLNPVTDVHPVLPKARQWMYFRVGQGADDPVWNAVRAKNTLGMRFSEKHLVNRDALVGNRRAVMSWERRPEPFPLQFALYAVPTGK